MTVRHIDLGGTRLPLDAATQTFGVLAVRGAGKSNLAAVMAEGMFEAGLPFVVVDPVGAWWGLRSSADGKSTGLSILIFGGRHGDVPLEETGGAVLADLVVDERVSCVLDISELSEGAKIRFLTEFAERLYRRNSEPLHLFLEEADDYIPQKPFREQARLLRAWENIVRRGRARGLGITLITQRSASINKNVLTQVETLFVLRTTSPQDRKAIEGWIQYHGTSREVLATLDKLAAGEAWVWSPQWLKTMERIQVRRRATFDSGATPKNVRGARPAATLAEVDLGKVRAKMAATIERAKADDPRELRRRIAELERQARRWYQADGSFIELDPAEVIRRRIEAAKQLASALKVERVEVPALSPEELRLLNSLEEETRLLREQLLKREIEARQTAQAILGHRTAAPAPVPVRQPPLRKPVAPSSPASGNGHDPGLMPARQRILDALAWLRAIGIHPADRTQLAFLSEQSPGSSSYANNLGALRTAGLIDYPGGGRVALTDGGAQASNPPEIPPTPEALHRQIERRLQPARWRIVAQLIETYPRALAREVLAERSGQSSGSSSFANNLGALRSLGLIDYPSMGQVIARPVLFLEGDAT